VDSSFTVYSAFEDAEEIGGYYDSWDEPGLADDIRSLSVKRGQVLHGASVSELSGIVFSRAFVERVAQKLRPRMQTAAEDESVTAWVGLNDATAVECLRFLNARKDKARQRLSVMGFDDTRDAAYHRLSSYNFNGASMMHAMVDHVLRPNSPLLGEAGAPVVARGFIHERATSIPVRALR
jgi:DNA-binding LacI/PurR family transcriptional regulator